MDISAPEVCVNRSATQSPSSPEPVLLSSQAELDAACADIRTRGIFAFDTEFVMEDRYEAEVCLAQVATEDAIHLIDPLNGLDLTPLWSLVADPNVETVTHAGQEDLGLCVQHTQRPPRNIFDVQIAAGFVGHEYPVSLQKLVQAIMHIRLHKSKTLTDWRKRPLSPEQIRYAAEDVAHLLPIRSHIERELAKRDRQAWVAEEFAKLELLETYVREEESQLRRIKGMGSLGGKQLVIARELLRWRDQVAERVNRPARTVLKDYLLVEIARLGASSVEEIRDLRGISLSRRDLDGLAQAVRKAAAVPKEQWPKQKRRESETEQETILLGLATAVVRDHCDRHELAYGLCASKKSLTEVIRHFARPNHKSAELPAVLTGWRAEIVGSLLTDLLQGSASIRVAHINGRPVLNIEVDAPTK
jgi:ribonuclease D